VDRLRSGLRISAFFKFSQRLSGRISTVGLSHGFMTNIVHHVPGGGVPGENYLGAWSPRLCHQPGAVGTIYREYGAVYKCPVRG